MGEIISSSPLPPAALWTLLGAGALAGVVIAIALLVAARVSKETHRVGPVFGDEHVDVVEWSGEEGYVRAGGELWRARSHAALAPGDRVKVVRMDGLMLDVSKK